MPEFDPWSRQELKRRRSAWLRRNARVVSFLVVGLALLMAVGTAAVWSVADGALRWYVLGTMHTTVVASGLHLLTVTFLADDRAA